ncbi:alpha/beta fold hydrolase [Tessaracoccus sp. MC1627]|uniref:alpha/beta fold hydrolase n=1 Tax=Tessaracoccus sp. MC1627 TaxID=2760312 RepID=UPI001C719277|nr:alpha/beta fold hydrolase [Tessaracoccus sp. MC1627]
METFANDGLTFEVRDSGPRRADSDHTVVLLHGFPQTPAAWDAVAPLLHAAGVRTLAPSLRGYTANARPPGRSAYRIECLVGDVFALLDQAGLDSAHVVGHDWGGGVAWAAAMTTPERVRSLTVLSTPHPAAIRRAVLRSSQGLKSWYMLAMQVPALPEMQLSRLVRKEGLRRLGVPADLSAAYAAQMSDAEAVRGMLGPYRGLFATAGAEAVKLDTPVSVPTTYLWGNRDPYLGRVAAEDTARYCTGDYRFVEMDAGHWLPEKRPEVVGAEILDRIR